MTLKAIETRYSGYRFRSRLEARWAVFFDALKVKWDYEPEGFELPDGSRYLADFFIHMRGKSERYPVCGYWIEIKPTRPSKAEIAKMVQLTSGTHHHGIFLIGEPGKNHHIPIDAVSGYRRRKPDSEPMDRLPHSQIGCCTPYDGDYDRFLAAANSARSARFEFGESGAA